MLKYSTVANNYTGRFFLCAQLSGGLPNNMDFLKLTRRCENQRSAYTSFETFEFSFTKEQIMIIKYIVLTILLISNALTTSLAYASTVQGAVVTRTEGESQIMIRKSNAPSAPAGSKSILFEKETYYVRPVKNGDRPANGDVITTGKDGKVRLIYRNGDQVTVTPGTAYKFSWDAKTEKNAVAEVVYGDIRAVIQPEGPRSGMQVKTKSAVMGVRGTDFYVSAWSKEAGSKVAVMRGTVAVTPQAEPAKTDTNAKLANKQPEKTTPPKAPEVLVSAGSSGVIKDAPAESTQTLAVAGTPTPPKIVEVNSTSKQELVVIQTDSKVTKPKTEELVKASDPIAKEIATLEAASVETTMQDVKKYDPQLYEKLKANNKEGKPVDADQIQAETVKKIFVTAPSDKKEVRKPTIDDLNDGGDIYEKYKWEKQ
jgi:hypothetical protein